ncbi:MAG: GYF domain-containing protein [Luteolibacter sp.]
MSDQWFIHSNGEQTGPYTGEQLVQYAQQGSITAETMVWAEGMPEWLPATQIEGLLPPAPAPAPAPAAPWAPPGARRPGTAGAVAATSPYQPPATALATQAPVGGDYPYIPIKQASFGLWVASFLGGFVLMMLGLFMLISSVATQAQAYSNGAEEMPPPQGTGLGGIIYLLVIIALVVSAVFFYINLHRAWKCLQFGAPRTTPGKAVGFLFIPFFNLYWMFVALAGLSKDWNRVIASHPDLHAAPKLNDTIFLLLCIGSLIFPPLAIIAIFPVASQMCKGINFFAARRNPNATSVFSALGGR